MASNLYIVNFHVIGMIDFSMIILIGICIQKYRKYRYSVLLGLIPSFMALIASSTIDLIFRFNPVHHPAKIRKFLGIGGFLFYLGTFILLLSIFVVRKKVPWFRLMVYAIVYGMLMQIHVSSEISAVFDAETAMWFTEFTTQHFGLLDILSSVPAIDIIVFLIFRQKQGFVNKRASLSVILFMIGILIPSILYYVPFADERIHVVIGNASLSMGYLLIAIAFTVNPMVFVFSKSQVHEIFLLRKDIGDLPIGGYSWIRQEFEGKMAAQVLAGITLTLDHIISNENADRSAVNTIDMGKKMIFLEHSEHLTMILIGDDLDELCREALSNLLTLFEKNLGNINEIDRHRPINSIELKNIVESRFTFVSPIQNANRVMIQSER